MAFSGRGFQHGLDMVGLMDRSALEMGGFPLKSIAVLGFLLALVFYCYSGPRWRSGYQARF